MAEPQPRTGETLPALVRAGPRAFLDLDRFDIICVIVLIAGSFLLRFASPIYPDFLSHPFSGSPVRAAGVGYPYNATGCTKAATGPNGAEENRCGFVFDEVYFPVDAEKDLHQPPVSYFDPEPPLAKSLMAPPIALFGFNTWSWRLSTTIAGSLFVGLVYLIARRLRRDRFFALAASLLVGADGLALVESRTGVIDMIAISLVALLYYVFLLHWQARTRTQWRVTLYMAAAIAGLALGAKLTALAPVAVAGALIVTRWAEPWLRRVPALARVSSRRATEGVLWRAAAGRISAVHYGAAVALMVVVFGACFARYLTIEHRDVYRFTSCSQSPSGLIAPTPPVMPPATVHIGGLTLFNPVQAARNVVEKTGADLQYHATECHRHDYSSRWYSWPVMYHPVLFYYATVDASPLPAQVSSITDMGNPVLWWLGIPALLFCAWRALRGPPLWRVGVAALGVGSLSLMMILFHAAQRPDTESVAVNPGVGFTLAFAGMVVFAAVIAISSVVSRRFVPGFIVLGYLTGWLMWVPGNERRILFFYHALGTLVFLALALAYALTALRRVSLTIGEHRVSLAPVAYAAIGSAFAALIFFYPIWTGAPLDQADHAMRIWVDTW